MSGVRQQRVRAISEQLGDVSLVWFGIRGEDAAPLLAVPQMRASFSITAPLRAGKLEESVALEDLTGERVDLDAYDIDLDEGADVARFRSRLLGELGRPSAVLDYRPSELLSSASFTARASCRHLGLLKDRQIAFEHKPWVETELAALGVRTIPWQYVATERRSRLARERGRYPLVLRPSRSSGGVGISVVRTPDELEGAWRDDRSHLMGVGPFLEHAWPLNINGCVFAGGETTLHPLSVQLIGIPELTTRQLGYCGNDFAAVADLPREILREADRTGRAIGRWLATMGYRGAFGVDYLVDGDVLYFAEVNARLQGSSRLSASLAARTDHLDIVLDHLAAFLGLAPAEDLTLEDWASEVPPAAQVIRHAAKPTTAGSVLPGPPRSRANLLPAPGLALATGAVEYCVEVDDRVTHNGFSLLDPGILGAFPEAAGQDGR